MEIQTFIPKSCISKLFVLQFQEKKIKNNIFDMLNKYKQAFCTNYMKTNYQMKENYT